MCKDTSSGIDQSGHEAKRRENLAHAAPMDSFSNCSNARISLRREASSMKKRTRDKSHLRALPNFG